LMEYGELALVLMEYEQEGAFDKQILRCIDLENRPCIYSWRWFHTVSDNYSNSKFVISIENLLLCQIASLYFSMAK